MDKVSYEAYETNEVYDSMDLNPKEKKVTYLNCGVHKTLLCELKIFRAPVISIFP